MDAPTQAREHVHRRAGRLLRPPPQLSVTAWAEQHRVLSSRGSAEPGPWRTARAPYLGAIMEALADISCQMTVGGTTVTGSTLSLFVLPLNQDGSTYGDAAATARGRSLSSISIPLAHPMASCAASLGWALAHLRRCSG